MWFVFIYNMNIFVNSSFFLSFQIYARNGFMPVSKDSAAFAWIAFIPSSGCEVSGLKTRFISAFWSPQVANRDLAKYIYRLYRGAPTDFSQMCKTIWNWSANQLAQVYVCRLVVRYQGWYIFRFFVFQLQVCLHRCVCVFLRLSVCVFSCLCVCVPFCVYAGWWWRDIRGGV